MAWPYLQQEKSESTNSVGISGEKPKNQPSRRRDILINIALLLLPMLTIPLILLAFVLYTHCRPVFNDDDQVQELPTNHVNDTGKYATSISNGSFLLVASWASTLAQFVMGPFMFLFAFVVPKAIQDNSDVQSREAAQKIFDQQKQSVQAMGTMSFAPLVQDIKSDLSKLPDDLAKSVTKASILDIWNATIALVLAAKLSPAARIATIGGILSGLFTVLLMIGDNILHVFTTSQPSMFYAPVLFSKNMPNLPEDYTIASYRLNADCAGLQGTWPCSINLTEPITNIANAVNAYSVLDTDISQVSSSFYMGQTEFRNYKRDVDRGIISETQVVMHEDVKTNLSHAMLFNMTAATAFSDVTNGTDNSTSSITLWGADYLATTTSMVTECIPATQHCDMHNKTVQTSSDQTIPFYCSPLFSGDVWSLPGDGLEQFVGWHAKFFDNSTGIEQDPANSSRLNPFYFNVTTAIRSVDFSILEAVQDPQVTSGAVVDAGNDRVALALSCKATVYDVTYSVVNYNIQSFNSVPASPDTAAVIMAPLELGFGRHQLYVQAQIGMLLNEGYTVAEYMSDVFSQVGIALASGRFDANASDAQRMRWYQEVTLVDKWAVWYLVIVCSLYAAVGTWLAVLAFSIRSKPTYAVYHALLVSQSQFSVTEEGEKLVKGGSKGLWALGKSIIGK